MTMKPKVKNWLTQVYNGNCTTKTAKIISEVRQYPGITIHGLRQHLRIPHQTMTSLMNVIMDEGILDIVGETEINGIHYSKFRMVESHEERELLIAKRRMDKFLQCIKRLGTDFPDLMSNDLMTQLRKHYAHYKNELK